MRYYCIDGETIIVSFAPCPASTIVTSLDTLKESSLTFKQMLSLIARLEGRDAAKLPNRKIAAGRLWKALEELPAPGPSPATPPTVGGAGSKQAAVIAMLRRPQGATLDEIAQAMQWQRHTVRGMIAGLLRKKLGLAVISEKDAEGRRTYRIAPAEEVRS